MSAFEAAASRAAVEEAAAEATANGFDGMDCVVVCDDCYHAAMKRMGHIPV